MAKDRQFERGGGIRWAIFSLHCLFFRFKEPTGARRVQLSRRRVWTTWKFGWSLVSRWQLFSIFISLSCSKIALYSHEYFIFILLRKRSVPFVLPLPRILMRSSSIFEEKKEFLWSKWMWWGMRMRDGVRERQQGSLISETKFAPPYHWLNNFAALISLHCKGSPDWRPSLLSKGGEFLMKFTLSKSPRLWTVCEASIGVVPCLCRAQGQSAISLFVTFSWQPCLTLIQAEFQL